MANTSSLGLKLFGSQLLFEIVVVLGAFVVIGWIIVSILEWFDKDEREGPTTQIKVGQEDEGCGCGCLIFIGVIAIGYLFYLFIFQPIFS